MKRLLSFSRLAARQRGMLVEAALYLLVTRAMLHIVPFKHLVWFFERPMKRPEIVGAEREMVRNEVVRVIRMVQKHLPGTIVCFPRAITAQAMLRRRGIGAVLYYGAALRTERGLVTHAWVQDGAEGVVGHWVAHNYLVLARYPDCQ